MTSTYKNKRDGRRSQIMGGTKGQVVNDWAEFNPSAQSVAVIIY
jgi:hypothetical protein